MLSWGLRFLDKGTAQLPLLGLSECYLVSSTLADRFSKPWASINILQRAKNSEHKFSAVGSYKCLIKSM